MAKFFLFWTPPFLSPYFLRWNAVKQKRKFFLTQQGGDVYNKCALLAIYFYVSKQPGMGGLGGGSWKVTNCNGIPGHKKSECATRNYFTERKPLLPLGILEEWVINVSFPPQWNTNSTIMSGRQNVHSSQSTITISNVNKIVLGLLAAGRAWEKKTYFAKSFFFWCAASLECERKYF